MQEVRVWVSVSGDYCAFHEMGFSVEFDITNNIQLGDMTLEELENFKFEGDYSDYETRSGYLIDGKYYVEW